tara:strand:- start:205 stop:510 length:306 start_codon:yes stop_codon:yes gene_type:complete
MLFFMFLACGESKDSEDTETTISDPSRFDQSCSIDEDCILVFEGDVCDCPCTYVGINAAEQRPWTEYYNGLYSLCDQEMIPDCAPCEPMVAVCIEGVCQAQ